MIGRRARLFADCNHRPPHSEARDILEELPPLSDRIAIEEINFVLEPEKAKQYGIDRAPAIALRCAFTSA